MLNLRDTQTNTLSIEVTGTEEAIVNWTGQEMGVVKANSWVWPRTKLMGVGIQYFELLSIINNL